MVKLLFFTLLVVVFAVSKASSPACDKITFVERSEWHARNATEPQIQMNLPVHHVFIHHTYEPDQCHNQSACVAAVRSVQDFHMDGRKWDDIGYNFLMGGDGRIYRGRGWSAWGHHTLGMNNLSIALSLIGNYESVAPPKFMLDLAHTWIDCALQLGIVSQQYQLHGHRDQTCTDCPGQRFYDIVKTWKNFVGGKLDSYVCKNSTLSG